MPAALKESDPVLPQFALLVFDKHTGQLRMVLACKMSCHRVYHPSAAENAAVRPK